MKLPDTKNTTLLAAALAALTFSVAPAAAWSASANSIVTPQKQEVGPAVAGEGSNEVLERRIDAFSTTDSDGKAVTLADYADKDLLAIIFVGTECPIANKYSQEINAIQERQRTNDLQILLINSNTEDTLEKVVKHKKEFDLKVPVLMDKDQKIADQFGATRTPEVFLLDKSRAVRYHGRIDDQIGYDHNANAPKRHDLEAAVKELATGQRVSIAETLVMGCIISRPEKTALAEPVTYARQIARLVQDNCETCHRTEGIGPMVFTDYKTVKQWGPMMKEVIKSRRMPPWFADPAHGKFANERRLTDEQVAMFAKWVDDGMAEGAVQDMPAARDYAGRWQIGQPDIVFELPNAVSVQANGSVPYQYYYTPTNFTEDKWIVAAECQPDNAKVVHHMILSFIDPASGTPLTSTQGDKMITGTAPGEEPARWPEGIAVKIPAGATLVWQMHYTPTGKDEKDRSRFGLKFAAAPPKYESRIGMIPNYRLRIPPGDPAYKAEAVYTFRNDAYMLSMMPHMHVRGKAFEYKAVYPDGTSEILLNVPKYDFNWQSNYALAQFKYMPQGTRIECTAQYDNSTANKYNPDPTEEVRWGDQTWEEMMIGWFSYIEAGPDAYPKASAERLETAKTAGETKEVSAAR